MASPAFKYVSPGEYLEMEKDAVEKNEYFKGEVIAMAGATENHVHIARNLVGGLHGFLKGKSCEVSGAESLHHCPTPICILT